MAGLQAWKALKSQRQPSDQEVKDLRSEIAHFGSEPGLGQFFVCYLG